VGTRPAPSGGGRRPLRGPARHRRGVPLALAPRTPGRHPGHTLGAGPVSCVPSSGSLCEPGRAPAAPAAPPSRGARGPGRSGV